MSETKLIQESQPQMTETNNVTQISAQNVSLQHPNHKSTHALCTNCGCSRASPPPLPPPSTGLHHHLMKRWSLEPTNPVIGTGTVTDPQEQPRTKRLFQDKQKTHSGQENSNLLGFTKISLSDINPSAQTHSFPVLRSCASDPCNPQQSPPDNSKNVGATALLPPPSPSLRRSVSDPTPSPHKSFTKSSKSNEMGVEQSPNSMRLRKMKEGLKEMTMWCEEILHEEEEEAAAKENSQNSAAMVHCGAEYEEAVNVERIGDCLIINFKCPCDNGYQIFLSENSCYYKLI